LWSFVGDNSEGREEREVVFDVLGEGSLSTECAEGRRREEMWAGDVDGVNEKCFVID